MPVVTTLDGTDIYYKDWGAGRPVILSHGWPLNSDSWEAQMLHLANHGHRVVAHDRRGHGRSSQPWGGNDMNTYADDLATMIEHLDLHNITLIGFAAGGGEAVRYIGRHGSDRLAQLILVSAVPPYLLLTDDNPAGMAASGFDTLRSNSLRDRSQTYLDLADGPFFGGNRPGRAPSQGVRDAFWTQGMQAGHRNTYEAISAFSSTDFRADLTTVDIPTLVIHGDDDQIVPFAASGQRSAQLIHRAELIVYAGAPHGITDTHKDRLADDLLQFCNRR